MGKVGPGRLPVRGRQGAGGRGTGSPRAASPLLPRGLLTEKAAPVMNIIHSVFSLVLKFRSQLISQPWGPAGGPHGAEHPNFALMQQSYSTFKYYSHFLFKGEPPAPAGRRAAGSIGAEGQGPGRAPPISSPSLRPFLHCPSHSGDQAGEPRLPAPPGGLPAAHQLQQLLPGRLSGGDRRPGAGRCPVLCRQAGGRRTTQRRAWQLFIGAEPAAPPGLPWAVAAVSSWLRSLC